jgi:hypothetical protein
MNDAKGDGVAIGRSGIDDRRDLAEAVTGDPSPVERVGQVGRPAEAEVGGSVVRGPRPSRPRTAARNPCWPTPS